MFTKHVCIGQLFFPFESNQSLNEIKLQVVSENKSLALRNSQQSRPIHQMNNQLESGNNQPDSTATIEGVFLLLANLDIKTGYKPFKVTPSSGMPQITVHDPG